MTSKSIIAQGILWAAAILASAILHAPPILSAVLLPSLAAVSLKLAEPRCKAARAPGEA